MSQIETNFSSQGTCSMETCPNDCIDFFSDDENSSSDNVWGRLYALNPLFASFDLVDENIAFGRGEECQYKFDSDSIKKDKCFPAYSKTHFKIAKESITSGICVFLHDTSSNGTFVNGKKVGKNKKQVLVNNDEIALAAARNRVFIFIDPEACEGRDLPEDLKDKYTVSRLLGKGACGEVKLAFEKGSCNKYAIKVVAKKRFSGTEIGITNDVDREIDILSQLHHPCMVKIHDVFHSEDHVYIVMELVEGGELFDRVVREQYFKENVAKLLFFQMVLAVKYLHDQGITHRDLKPENILMSSAETNNTTIKVTDFGLSKLVHAESLMKTFCGTPNYLAPEIILTAGVGSYTNKIDCWSLGVILFICLVGYPPFSEERNDGLPLRHQITKGNYSFPDALGWNRVSEEAKDLVRKLLTVDPDERFGLTQAIDHPWFQDEEMKIKVNKLLYPKEEMGPPTNSVILKKRKGDDLSICDDTILLKRMSQCD